MSVFTTLSPRHACWLRLSSDAANFQSARLLASIYVFSECTVFVFTCLLPAFSSDGATGWHATPTDAFYIVRICANYVLVFCAFLHACGCTGPDRGIHVQYQFHLWGFLVIPLVNAFDDPVDVGDVLKVNIRRFAFVCLLAGLHWFICEKVIFSLLLWPLPGLLVYLTRFCLFHSTPIISAHLFSQLARDIRGEKVKRLSHAIVVVLLTFALRQIGRLLASSRGEKVKRLTPLPLVILSETVGNESHLTLDSIVPAVAASLPNVPDLKQPEETQSSNSWLVSECEVESGLATAASIVPLASDSLPSASGVQRVMDLPILDYASRSEPQALPLLPLSRAASLASETLDRKFYECEDNVLVRDERQSPTRANCRMDLPIVDCVSSCDTQVLPFISFDREVSLASEHLDRMFYECEDNILYRDEVQQALPGVHRMMNSPTVDRVSSSNLQVLPMLPSSREISLASEPLDRIFHGCRDSILVRDEDKVADRVNCMMDLPILDCVSHSEPQALPLLPLSRAASLASEPLDRMFYECEDSVLVRDERQSPTRANCRMDLPIVDCVSSSDTQVLPFISFDREVSLTSEHLDRISNDCGDHMLVRLECQALNGIHRMMDSPTVDRVSSSNLQVLPMPPSSREISLASEPLDRMFHECRDSILVCDEDKVPDRVNCMMDLPIVDSASSFYTQVL